MKKHTFRIGDEIDLYTRSFKITSYNGSIIAGEERELGDDGEWTETAETAYYSKADLARALKEIDGENHEVTIEG